MSTGVLFVLIWLSAVAQQPPSSSSATPASSATPQSAAESKAAKPQRAVIRAEAEKTVSGFADAKDPALQAAVCEADSSLIPGATCERARKAMDPSAVAKARISELATKSDGGDADAAEELRRFTEELKTKDPAAAIEGVRAMDGRDGSEMLRELTTSQKPEIRELAAGALAEKDPDQARELVKQALAGKGQWDVAFQAAVGLAAAGDAEQVTRVSEWLPTLRGRAQFTAASALMKSGSVDGVTTLAQIARSADDEMLRLHAAAALIGVDSVAAGDAVSHALDSENLWVRGEAAALAARLGDEWLDRVKSLLSDSNEWVRLRAATALLTATTRK